MLPIAAAGMTFMDKVESWALTWMPIILMCALVYLIWRSLKMMPRTKPQQIKPESSGGVGWDDVAGCDEAKAELREVVEFLRTPERFSKLGASVPKGILLHGPPGTGKTLLAKAVAKESGAHFFSQSASSFVEMFAGLGAARIRRLFAIAKEHAPAIIFIDEIDAVGLKRGFDISREKDQTLNQLLVEMDGFSGRDDIIVIAASNRIDGLDPALLRPGRFDRQVLVSAPDLEGREEILKVHTRNMPVQDVDLHTVARRTSGLTGADLANLCNEAAIYAGREGRDSIQQVDFDGAFERVVAGLQTRRVITPREKEIIAYHEAGHALVSEMLPNVPKVHKISIVPRGQALGYTLNLPEEDRYLMSKEDLLDYMKMLLGGFVTEQIVFDRVTTGASDDLRRVAEISRSMIEQYGMGSKLLAHLDGSGRDQTSQAALEARDREQQLLIDQAQFDSRMLVLDNRELLDRIAQALLDKESIERHEIDALVAAQADSARDEALPDPIVGLPSIGTDPEPLFEEELTGDGAESSASPRARRDSIAPPRPGVRESIAPPNGGVPAPVRATEQD
ncbi:MAG TPA: AAA family ATPase [Solirubrobacterales bacterium]|nr:AAA family ATPase [Solirubrobacterales bacterium]